MAISTLVLGIGGTGVLSLRALKKLYAELPEEERVPAGFLAFDFDRSALTAGDPHDRFADLEETEFLYLNPNNIQDLLRNLNRSDNGGLAWEKVLQWFPDRSHVQIPASEVESNGASQLRVLGRLGFFQNDEIIEATVRRKLTEIGSEVDPNRLSEGKRVILVSSLAGGTGAGMLVDMAYIARRQEIRPRIFAYLLLPEVFQDVDSGGRIFQNSYACLKELAYLKDQQIPFQAQYYDIPPVDVPVGGEEPFARIFLCRGDGFAGADAIKEATVQIAESILAQLERSIQEKTLAVVSNTLSASPADEQKRRRTHCFSTATSVSLPLRPVESFQEAILQLIVQIIRDPDSLEAVLAQDLSAMLEQLRERIAEPRGTAGDTAVSVPGEGQEAGDQVPEEAKVRELLRVWTARIDRAAREAQERILHELSQQIDAAETSALTGRKDKLDQALASIDGLKPLILADFRPDCYEENLANLRRLPSFTNSDQSHKDEIRTYLRALEGTFNTEEAVRRKLLYHKLESLPQLRGMHFPESSSEEGNTRRKAWADREEKLKQRRSLRPWRRVGDAGMDNATHVRWCCAALREGLKDPVFQANVSAILKARFLRVLGEQIAKGLELAQENLRESERPWRDLLADESVQSRKLELPEPMKLQAFALLRQHLPAILDEARTAVHPEDEPQVKRKKLMAIVQKRIQLIRGMKQKHFLLELEPDKAEERIREALVRARQRVFERRTPNPQRKGFALVMVPEGLVWPDGRPDALRSFLEASTTQILSSRSQVIDYRGSRIWIYAEDLFNPPEHIRNLDEYFRNYQSQQYKELFHIDRRMLRHPSFREINSSTSSIVITCGNPDCRENIAAVPRTQRVCPFCNQPILSRCGNERCTENGLNRHSEGKAKTCPSCGSFNHAAWWRCCKHGKVEVDVPIDKLRCPLCIEAHLDDPIAWPTARISVRPDLVDSVACPRCEDLNGADPKHEIYYLPKELLPFYRDGVNGHDREAFEQIAIRRRLPDRVRCPSCRTFLIPIHHHQELPVCAPRRRR